jgi:carboxylesterase type B
LKQRLLKSTTTERNEACSGWVFSLSVAPPRHNADRPIGALPCCDAVSCLVPLDYSRQPAASAAGVLEAPSPAAKDILVKTRWGDLRGSVAGGVRSFKGVPFAAPPFRQNRLRPPQAVEAWDGVRNALAFGPKSPQVEYPPGIAEALAELVGPGEDCLTLNIWAPEPVAAARPVMVWIPNGMFEFHATGATAYYDGSQFARDGIVCVTINYRVGAEGFLFLGNGLANLGLLDQIAALRWIQENISAFGGDPGNVTIFGESAGGMSVATLLTMPRARGLFRRAIVQSGNTPIVNSATTAERIGRRLAGVVGIEAKREGTFSLSARSMPSAQVRQRI